MATTLADRPTPPRKLSTRRKKKNGIVLLMVVSLLALFLLMGVTFAVLAIQYKTAADVQAQKDRYGDPPMVETDLALGQLLYGSANRSSIEGHDLLRDFYGQDYVEFTVGSINADANKTCGGQFTVLAFARPATMSQAPGFYNGRVLTFTSGVAAGYSTRIAGYEPGTAGGNAELYIETIRANGMAIVTPAANDAFLINGQPFNGMGFGYDPYTLNIDAVDFTTNQQVSLMPHYAGYSTRYASSNSPIAPIAPATGSQFAPDVAGADEPYDAPDSNNMAMALVSPSQFVGGNQPPLLPSFQRPDLVAYWLAHWPGGGTPTLKGEGVSTGPQKNFIRQVIFRPMPWDHHNFTGSNPNLSLPASFTDVSVTDAHCETLLQRMAQQGGWNPSVWDVDNDSDGVRDSIWVDIGLPVMTSPTGRRYKRLFAFLVKDLDGRLSVNVHGTRAQDVSFDPTNANNRASAPVQYPFPVFGGSSQPMVSFPLGNQMNVSGSSNIYLPRGMGFGPAEVDIQIVIGTANYSNLLAGRYGGDGYPGLGSTNDPLSVVKFSGIPNNYLPTTAGPPLFPAPGSWYASPPDVWGRGAVVVDYGGKPMHFRMATSGETLDDPYEMEWEPSESRNDTPYSHADMERLLRAHDPDAQFFSSRLITAVPALGMGAGDPTLNGGAHQRARESLTTMGTNVPSVPGIASYQERVDMRAALVSSGAAASPAEASQQMMNASNSPSPHALFAQRLVAGGVSTANVPTEMAKIFPIEFWQGTRLNINRFLGNGINDNNATDSVRRLVDEPAESQTFAPLELAWGDGTLLPPTGGALPAGFSGQRAHPVNSVDADNNGTVDLPGAPSPDIQYARQLMARHLYCLMLAIKDGTFNSPALESGYGVTSEATARRMAQWAINVVDFRDQDAVMTAFEYDVNPWNGWSTDGNLMTNEGADRRVVWGCEYPELLLTETVAFHNRRVKDTRFDTTGNERAAARATDSDNDVDQFRVPQGSLFFEMFCTRSHTQYNVTGGQESMYNSQLPWELYDRTTGKLALDRTTPGGNPVWQVAIANLTADPDSLPHTRVQGQQWDSTLYSDPTDPAIVNQSSYQIYSDVNVLTGGGGVPVDIERYVWFTPGDGGAANPKRNRVFHNQRNWNAQVAPGQYVVVGPREDTYVSSLTSATGWGGNAPQRIELNNTTGVTITDNSGATTSYNPGTQIQPVVALVADTRPPDAWVNAATPNRRVGMNITEPLTQGPNYYTEYNTGNDARMPFDAYHDPSVGGNTLIDAPFDNSPTRPIGQANMVPTRTYPNRSALFLQRLADPTRDWNPATNPYITVDYSTVDVTVYTGEEDTDRRVMIGLAMEDVDPPDPTAGRVNPQFGTEQRGNEEPVNTANGNPWFPVCINKANNTPDAGLPAAPPYMRHSLRHTFGYINEPVGTPRTDKGAAHLGDPTNANKPFPWLTWNNRPFMNPAELLLVPISPASRLLMDFSPDHPSSATVPSAYITTGAENYRAPFVHLLNFFHSSTTPGAAANYSRLMDYVETPSPFVGAERWYSPSGMSVNGTAPYYPYVPPFLYRPPFNRLSRFRDPGRININTIFDEAIWQSINGYDSSVPTLANLRVTGNQVFTSRQGTGTALGTIDPNYPSLFSNPFRPANCADLMPNIGNMRKSPVEATLLRSGGSGNNPLLANQNGQLYNDPDRNPYFRYQGLQKVSNIVGTQSNCYAAWITVGYFEVEENPNGIDAAHPDGFMLGQELGLDVGDTQRHRSFYLIDRSIPVGFIPGVKLNADNCVLLRRQID